MAMPSSVTVEIEFTAGTWTDVTAYLDGSAGGSTRFGRTSPFGTPAPGTLSLTLANDDGRFTPGRQVLADGVTAHPYYPNVVPRKRIRVAYVISGTPYYRFTGYIKGWPPSMVDGDTARVQITATTRDDQLARVALQHLIIQEHNAQSTAAGGSSALYLMNDPVDGGAVSASFDENDGKYSSINSAMGAFNTLSFSSSSTPLPASDGLTGLSAVNGSLSFSGSLRPFDGANWAISAWVTIPILNSGNTVAGSTAFAFQIENVDNTKNITLAINYPSAPTSPVAVLGAGQVGSPLTALGSVINATVNNDGQPHHYALTGVTSGGTQTVTMYVDGVSVGSTSFASGQLVDATLGTLVPIVTTSVDAGYQDRAVVWGPTSIFWGGAYTSTLAVALNGAGRGFAGETTSARIARFLRYAGLTSSDWTLDTGVAVMGSQPVSGQDPISLCQACAVTEGGGAAFYVGTDGKMQFRNRLFRKPGTPAVTVDAEADLDGGTFSPVYDDTQIVNQVLGARGTADGSGPTQTANDATSQAAYGLTSSSFTSYASTDLDVLYNAQDQLAQQRQPSYQVGQVTVDLATAATAGLYAAVAGVDIGDRLRITNLPVKAAPATQVDLYAEGWADTFSTDEYTVTFDTSTADDPPWFMLDDVDYGLLNCSGQTLSASITNSATTIVVATSGSNPTFTTNAAVYPMTITIGTEHISLNSAPSGATSPQTFTGVTRGVDGTTAAAQSAGTSIDLAPAPTLTL